MTKVIHLQRPTCYPVGGLDMKPSTRDRDRAIFKLLRTGLADKEAAARMAIPVHIVWDARRRAKGTK